MGPLEVLAPGGYLQLAQLASSHDHKSSNRRYVKVTSKTPRSWILTRISLHRQTGAFGPKDGRL